MSKKKKSKKNKKGKSLNYRLFIILGSIFHFIVYLLYDLTFYNDRLFLYSLLFCGLISGIYIISKMKLLNPNSYNKIKGIKLKMYIFFVCIFTIIGTTLIFGNALNGTILGLNYIGKGNKFNKSEYRIQKITQNKTGSRKGIRKNVPKVYLEKDGELINLNLKERYSSIKNYSEYKTIEVNLKKGLLGFQIIDSYELKE